ncbi:MAG: XRE family transcriptional regulator [Amaricoccus sp.]|uniref:helix-turn-helix domain-containing protein n=1 Tax=Amaricoccus sp. TaxID=1872485 RepID=UPI0039E3A51B
MKERAPMVEPGPPAAKPARLVPRRRNGQSIAATLRAARTAAGLSLTELAHRCGLAISTLSKIENGQMSPTYDTMVSLADGLAMDLADLVSGGRGLSVNGRKTVTRAGQGIVVRTAQYDYEMLCSEIADRQFVPLLAEIKARSTHEFPQLITHAGEEFIYVLAGRVELHTEFYAPTVLDVGDGCYFDSTMGHALVNMTDEIARVMWIASRVVAPLDRPQMHT